MSIDRIRVGTIFFAVALLGLGVEHFVFGDFITGRAPAWPETVPGGRLFAALTGIVFIVTGLALIFQKGARRAAIVAAILIASWALLRHIPILFTEPFMSGAWTRAGKALLFTGGALAVSGARPNVSHAIGRWTLGLFLLIAGVQHFLFAKFVASLIPAWFPGSALFWAYFAGVALLCGGVGVLIPRTARLAAFWSGIMIFSWFWIVHIPRVSVGVSDQIAVFEALAFSGIAFLLSGYESKITVSWPTSTSPYLSPPARS